MHDNKLHTCTACGFRRVSSSKSCMVVVTCERFCTRSGFCECVVFACAYKRLMYRGFCLSKCVSILRLSLPVTSNAHLFTFTQLRVAAWNLSNQLVACSLRARPL
jgi:hypothetical protein